MAQRSTHWYLRSWAYEDRLRPDGTKARELVYQGEYYHVVGKSGTLLPLKLGYLASAVVLWLVLAVLLTHFSRGASLFFVGGPCGITLIPAIYLAIGCIQLLRVPEKMTYRDVQASYRRIRLASKWAVGLMAVCLVGEVFYLSYRLIGGLEIAWGAEGLWLGGSLLAVLAPAVNLWLLRRYRVELCPRED
jgi:hypothetical protein